MTVKIGWLFSGLIGFWCLFPALAEAANLQFWQFDQRNNRLELRTDDGVQPRAQLVFNPTRLVIDLPGTRLGRPKQLEQFNGSVTAMRVAQFDRDTTRIVLELAPGYTINPNQVRFRYTTARNWIVELPSPESNPDLANAPQTDSQTLEVPQAPNVPPPLPSNPGGLFPSAPRPNPISPSIPAGRPVVIIDPGHGGPDPGAVGIGGLRETDVVLDISRQVTALLAQQGIAAVLTRDAEYDLGLEPRVQMANRANATVFVSIHANAISMSRPDVNGLETYYFTSGKELADVIHRTVLEETGVRDRRVRQARFYVLRYTSMPSVLVETGFVTGAEDAARLRDPSYRSRMAAAIARGILRYLGRSG
ncbi:MAG: N-acetylmuramoyl-L-alanine amidase [Leptolyngbyaceae cyanobacterium bins.349]|nr:N-acetylmuramoyl-L-alanine amidase [Leptolyngbyaceae cyanobacterium bins.349]